MTQPQKRLGVARGSISIGLENLQQQRTVAIKTAQDIGKSFTKSFDDATNSTQKLNKGLGALPQSALDLKTRFTQLRTEGVSVNATLDSTSKAVLTLGNRLKAMPKDGVELGGLPNSALSVRSRFNQLGKELDTTKAKLNDLGNEAVTLEPKLKRPFTASISVVNTFRQRLDSTVARIKSIQAELQAVFVSGTATTFFGLRAADNLQNLRIRFRELAGDQERGLALMDEIGEAAERLNLPVRQTQNAFSGLIPAMREAGGEVDVYINRVARLATVNPREGVEGAVFAVREALSSGGTDLVSLAERFNLPRARLRQLTEETGDFAEALDIVLNEQGATNEALADFSGNLATASTRIRDAATRALEKAFIPQLDTVVNLLNSASSGIDALPDGFLQFAGGAITATTAAAGFALGLSQVVSTYDNLKKSGIFNAQTNGLFSRSGAGTAGVIAVAGLAAAPGISTSIARGVGRASNNERLANTTTEDAGTVIRQAGALVGVAIIESGRAFVKSIGFFVAQFITIPQQFNALSAQLDIAGYDFVLTLLNLMGRVNSLIPGVELIQTDVFRDTINIQRENAVSRLELAQVQFDVANQVLEDGIDATFDEYLEGNMRLFGFAEVSATEAEAVVVESLQSVERRTDSLFQNMSVSFERIAIVVRERLAEIDSAIRFGTELNRLGRDGSVEQVASRIDGLNDERQAIEALLPELEALAGSNQEAADALANYQDKLSEIDGQINQLADLTPSLLREALTVLGNEFAEQVSEIEAERGDSLATLASDLADDLEDLNKDLASQFTDARKEELDAVVDYQEEREEIEADHQKRMLEIEQSGRDDIASAAGRLDAAGVRAAQKARAKQLDEAKDSLVEAREQNNERLADVRENLAEERREILDNYNERRNDLIVASNAERQVIQRRYQDQINTATQAFNIEAQQLNQQANRLLQMQSSAQQAELSNKKSGYDAMVQGAQTFANSMRNIGNSLSSATKSRAGGTRGRGVGSVPSGSKGGSTMTTRVRPQDSSRLSQSINAEKISRFSDGGKAIFGGSGEALAFIRNKERVLTPQQTSSFDKLVSMLGGNMSGGRAPDLSSIPIDISGVESFEQLVENVTRQVLGAVYKQQIAGGGA